MMDSFGEFPMSGDWGSSETKVRRVVNCSINQVYSTIQHSCEESDNDNTYNALIEVCKEQNIANGAEQLLLWYCVFVQNLLF